VVLYQYYTAAFPQIVVAWNDLGEIYLMQGKKEDAIPCFEQALKIRPGNPRARENLQKLGK
jgi:TolA-binding protein